MTPCLTTCKFFAWCVDKLYLLLYRYARQLCRRSFGSSEMLRKHEKKSKLHKENLAAAAAAARGGDGGGLQASGVAVGGGI